MINSDIYATSAVRVFDGKDLDIWFNLVDGCIETRSNNGALIEKPIYNESEQDFTAEKEFNIKYPAYQKCSVTGPILDARYGSDSDLGRTGRSTSYVKVGSDPQYGELLIVDTNKSGQCDAGDTVTLRFKNQVSGQDIEKQYALGPSFVFDFDSKTFKPK